MKQIECYWIANGQKEPYILKKEVSDLEQMRQEIAEIHKVQKSDVLFRYKVKMKL